MDDKLILKNRLKDARTERGLSQSALAELVKRRHYNRCQNTMWT